jgi:hypothetical protein
MSIYSEDMHSVFYCRNVEKHTEFNWDVTVSYDFYW